MSTSFRAGALVATIVFSAFTAFACSTTVTSAPSGWLGDGGTSTDKDPTSSSTANGGTICAKFCENAKSAGCSSQSTCEADCKKQIDASPEGCKDAAEAMITCGGTAKFDGCSASGKPKLTGCDAETLAYLQCVQSGGKKDAGTTTTPKCDQLETGIGACDSCMDSKCCAQETACIDEPDCTAFYDCLGSGASQTSCKGQHPAGAAVATKIDQCMQAQCATPCQ